MPDTVFDEDTLAAASEAMGEEEERPLTFAELGVPGPLVRVLAADDKKTAFPLRYSYDELLHSKKNIAPFCTIITVQPHMKSND